MARQARILDFEEAKTSSSSRTRNRSAQGRSSSSRSGSGRGSSSARSSSSGRGSSSRTNTRTSSARRGTRGASSAASSTQRSTARSSRTVSQSQRSTNTKTARAKRTTTSKASKQTQSTRSQNTSRTQNASRKQAISRKAEAVKRERVKKKADRLFANNVSADAPADEGPRAALYKGKMGSSHKKSAKMQRDQKEGRTFSLPHISWLTARRATVAVAVLCVVASCAFLYGPAKNYYTAQRDQAKAQVAYEIVTTRNQALLEDVALLSSEVGMEDRVREQYGWVKEGENAVIVKGLSDDGSQSAADVLQSTALADVVAPETWYSPVLDRVFGYGV